MVVAKGPPPPGTRRIGPVAVSGRGCGSNAELGSEEAALDQLREQAAQMGADYLELEGVERSTDAASCKQYQARAIAWDTRSAGLVIIGPSPSPSATPAAPAPRPAPSASESKAARLPPPVGTPRYALGFDRAVDGCLKGEVYTQQGGDKQLADGYSEAAPSAALWGCEWNFSDLKLSDAVPGAKPGQSYAVRYQGTFEVGSSGVFKFGVASSTDARVVIDGAAMTDDSAGAAAKHSGSEQALYLGAGRHQILIEYLAAGDAMSLKIAVTLPGASQAAPFSVRPSGPFYAEQGLDYTGPAGSTGDEWRKLVSVEADQLKLNGRVYFQSASAALDHMDQTENALLAVAKTLRERQNMACVEIAGHTDNRGDGAGNQRLSEQRAAAVREWLVQAGIEPHRLVAVGFGGERPIASNESEAGRASNRRVEFLIRAPNAAGACPRSSGSSSPGRSKPPRPVAPELAERACNSSASLRGKLLAELEPWLKEHRSCSSDSDCTQAIPLECPGKSRALDCAWVLVNQANVDALRVTGARLDSIGNYCKELPEDGLVRSCGSCAAKPRHCHDGTCELGAQ